MKAGNLAKYLAAYAEPDAKLQPPRGLRYCAAIVVPACGEEGSFLHQWQRVLNAAASAGREPHGSRSLVVLVINADPTTTAAFNQKNCELFASLVGQEAMRLLGPFPAWLVARVGFDILVVDRFSSAFQLPPKAGVGLARKIGGDIVSAWYHQGIIEQPWWLSTDADVLLPSDVVAQLSGLGSHLSNAGVACLPFEHISGNDRAVDDATFAVEVKLRYHVLGLRYAGSPYAWHALGSCLIIHTSTYAAVRGFPKRLAGEDFYFLQKVSKIAPVLELTGEPARIVARRSKRTPFGTGREVSVLENNADALELRHPETYTCLKHVLMRFDQLAEESPTPYLLDTGDTCSEDGLGTAVPPRVFDGWSKAVRAATTPEARRRRLHEWFDGLRTIQLLNAAERKWPPLPWASALHNACFVPEHILADRPNFKILAARLKRLEAITPSQRGSSSR